MTTSTLAASVADVARGLGHRYRSLPGAVGLLLRALAVVALLAVVGALLNSYQASVVATALIYGIAAMGLTVLMGWVGRPSVMTASNLLAGSYVAVFAANELQLNFLFILLLCLVAGAIFGAIAALPGRRLGGIYLLLSTLAIYYIVTDLGNIIQSHQTALGGYYPNPASLFGMMIESSASWMWIAGGVAFLVFEYFRYLRSTRIGRAWIMIRDTEEAAGVAGIRLPSYVMTGFTVTTAVQFLAGGLLAFQIGSVSYNTVSLQLSVSFIVMIVLGRMGSLGGAIVGALIVNGLPVFMNSWFGSASSSGWLAKNLVAIESILFALIGVAVLLNVPRLVSHWTRAAGHRRRSAARTWTPQPGGPGGFALRFDDVSVQYGAGEQAVTNATLDVTEGGVVALLGRNGAGKTSLLYSAAGFPPGTRGRLSTGRVLLRKEGDDDLDISRHAITVRNRLGIVLVPAEDKVFVDLTVREHLREAIASGTKRRSQSGRDPIGQADLLGTFPDLAGKLDRAAGNLSGGERQQLALAMAIARDARILLIDEASLGLAPIAIASIEPVLRQLGERSDRSLVLAEQNARLAARVAGRLALLESGRIVRQGPPDEDFLHQVEQNYLGVAVESDGAELRTTSKGQI